MPILVPIPIFVCFVHVLPWLYVTSPFLVQREVLDVVLPTMTCLVTMMLGFSAIMVFLPSIWGLMELIQLRLCPPKVVKGIFVDVVVVLLLVVFREAAVVGCVDVLIYVETPFEMSKFARDFCYVLLSNSSSLNVVEVQPMLSSFNGHAQVVVEAEHVVYVDIEACANQVGLVPQVSIDTQCGSNVGGHLHTIPDSNNLGQLVVHVSRVVKATPRNAFINFDQS